MVLILLVIVFLIWIMYVETKFNKFYKDFIY
jgi:hypothetical protein